MLVINKLFALHKNNLIELKNPALFTDGPITKILRNGAKKLLAEALEAEFLSKDADLKDEQGRMRDSRNG